MDWLQIATAGLWPLVWKFGLGGAIIVGLLAAAWFSPIWKTHFLWGAALVGAIMITFSIGVKDGSARVQAQWDAAVAASIEQSKTARSDAERDVSRDAPSIVSDDIYNRDNARR